MKILCIDSDACALDFCMRALAAGHEVRWWNHARKDGTPRRNGEGLVPLIRDYEELWKKWLGWADLIWLTSNGKYLERLEPYRQMGYPIYGSNVAGAKWETDRAMGQAVMKKAGLKIIPSREFRDHDAAIAYVQKEGVAFVCKPNGDIDDKSLSYVAHDAADLIFMLRRWKENPKYRTHAKEEGFIVQQKISGCEMGVGGFFGPIGWLGVWEENFEYKKFMNDDCGPNTGEQGTLMRFVKQSKLADMVLTPLTKQLKAIDFCGCVDVNCMIDDQGIPWPLEFTMRDGWPAKHNQMSLMSPGADPAQWKLDLLNGKDTLKVELDTVSISVVMTLAPFPKDDDPDKVTGIPIYGANDAKAVHLCDAMLGEAPVAVGNKVIDMPCYLTCGHYVLVVTGTGETITGARRSAYSSRSKIRIPNDPQWRTDIGRSKLVDNLEKIQLHGFARNLSF